MAVAAVLLGFILLRDRFTPKAKLEPLQVLPAMKAGAATSVQVKLADQPGIRAERTNGTWRLTEPVSYPAQTLSIEKLLGELEKLKAASMITARELRDRPRAAEEYGLASPQAAVTVEQPGSTLRLRVGATTTPGDQVFVQPEGREEVLVVDSAILQYLPRKVDDWRETSFLKLAGLSFDRLAVANGSKAFEVARPEPGQSWRMISPLQARANSARLEESLQALQNLTVHDFVSDDPKVDLAEFGLQPPELEIRLAQGTNPVARLQFGKAPTNDTRLVYARRPNLNAVVTVPKDLLTPWYAPVNEFRDPALVTWNGAVGEIDVAGVDQFSLQLQTNGAWRVLPQNLPADPGLVKGLLEALGSLSIVEYTSDVATAQDLPAYGLAAPSRRYVLKTPLTNGPAGPTNAILIQVDFGTNQADKVYARRTDENFIYAIKYTAFETLPSISWELRDRGIWHLNTNDIKGLLLEQQGRRRQLDRQGPNDWTPATGMNVLGVEEAVKGLCDLTAVAWVALGEENRARYGLTGEGRRITVEMKDGHKALVEFSVHAAPNSPYAAVTLDGQLWIFQFPTWLYDYVQRYLTVPQSP